MAEDKETSAQQTELDNLKQELKDLKLKFNEERQKSQAVIKENRFIRQCLKDANVKIPEELDVKKHEKKEKPDEEKKAPKNKYAKKEDKSQQQKTEKQPAYVKKGADSSQSQKKVYFPKFMMEKCEDKDLESKLLAARNAMLRNDKEAIEKALSGLKETTGGEKAVGYVEAYLTKMF